MSIEVLTRLSEQITAAQDSARKNAKDAFAASFRDFFKTFPEVSSLFWNQGTPGFNDGDPCTFSRHEMNLSLRPGIRALVDAGVPLEAAIVQVAQQKTPLEIADEDDDEEDDCEEDSDQYVLSEQKSSLRAQDLIEAFEALEALDDDLYLFAFGDNKSVRATVKGITTDYYSDY